MLTAEFAETAEPILVGSRDVTPNICLLIWVEIVLGIAHQLWQEKMGLGPEFIRLVFLVSARTS
jgi:hypothetical protein